MLHCRIPRFRFAASDPLWAGIDQVPKINPAWAARWPDGQGPLRGRLAAWAAALPARWSLEHSPGGSATSAYRFKAPDLAGVAARLHLYAGATVVEAMEGNWSLLPLGC